MAEAGAVKTPPLVAEETKAVGAAERAAKVAAEKLAADTAAAAAETTAPLDAFQQMMQSSIASLNAAMAVLQATLTEARAENLATRARLVPVLPGWSLFEETGSPDDAECDHRRCRDCGAVGDMLVYSKFWSPSGPTHWWKVFGWQLVSLAGHGVGGREELGS